jgi:hypothetical protein
MFGSRVTSGSPAVDPGRRSTWPPHEADRPPRPGLGTTEERGGDPDSREVEEVPEGGGGVPTADPWTLPTPATHGTMSTWRDESVDPGRCPPAGQPLPTGNSGPLPRRREVQRLPLGFIDGRVGGRAHEDPGDHSGAAMPAGADRAFGWSDVRSTPGPGPRFGQRGGASRRTAMWGRYSLTPGIRSCSSGPRIVGGRLNRGPTRTARELPRRGTFPTGAGTPSPRRMDVPGPSRRVRFRPRTRPVDSRCGSHRESRIEDVPIAVRGTVHRTEGGMSAE